MQFKHEQVDEQSLRIYIQGRVDVNTSGELRQEIASVGPEIKHLYLDIRDVPYISSAGLRELLVCRKRFPGDGEMLIENVSEDIYEVFEDVGMASIIPLQMMEEDKSTYVSLSFQVFLARKVKDAGSKVVLGNEYENFTWEDIEMASQIVADDLAKRGVKKRTHVALTGANSINWVITFYALQKLGALTMLINPGQPADKIANTANIGDVTYVCYGEMSEMGSDEEGFLNAIRQASPQITGFYSIKSVVHIRERFGEYPALKGRIYSSTESDDPAIMIFTSGSTGVPKGVLLSSYNVLNAASANYKDQTLNEQDRTCLILPLFHIFGLVAGLFANAMANSTVYIPRDIHTGTLISMITEKKCTIFHSVPTMLIALMNNKAFGSEKFSSLRCTIISGAAATEAQIKMFKEKLPNDHFLASYGLSEMAPVSITNYEDTDEHVLHSVGRPVNNIQVKIQNKETGQECPKGVSGEILVQGFNLMVGYYKADISTQSIDQDGWLHTGDLGLITENNYLCISGRLKELIIRGGENIMPGEIETAISTLDYIDNVRVIGIPSEFYGEEVCACLKLKAGEAFSEEKVRADLAGRLPKFKIPSTFMIYESFPMLGTGKIDTVTLKKDVINRLSFQA